MAEYKGLEGAWRNARPPIPKGKFFGVRQSPFGVATKQRWHGLRRYVKKQYQDPEVRQLVRDVGVLYLGKRALTRFPNFRIRALNALRQWKAGRAARKMGRISIKGVAGRAGRWFTAKNIWAGIRAAK